MMCHNMAPRRTQHGPMGGRRPGILTTVQDAGCGGPLRAPRRPPAASPPRGEPGRHGWEAPSGDIRCHQGGAVTPEVTHVGGVSRVPRPPPEAPRRPPAASPRACGSRPDQPRCQPSCPSPPCGGGSVAVVAGFEPPWRGDPFAGWQKWGMPVIPRILQPFESCGSGAVHEPPRGGE